MVMSDNDKFMAIIERFEAAERNHYLERGLALLELRDERAYRDHKYDTFDACCEQHLELTPRRAGQLIAAAQLGQKLNNCSLNLPSRESHIRPLVERLEQDEDRISVWRDVLATTNGVKIKAKDVDDAIGRFLVLRNKEYVTLSEWRELKQEDRASLLARRGKKGMNRQDNAEIEWASWSWNPITGCLHGCPYCYARDIAFEIYPQDVGFAPTLWPDRLAAPYFQAVPQANLDDPIKNMARKNIFTCSMADLFGRWVPAEWIQAVLDVVAGNPKWNFLFLTKFPKRMSEFDIPKNAWMGTTVDLQARVKNAEDAFANVKAGVKWLSIEPMLEPIKFERLDLFDWMVIGGASPSRATDGTPATPEWNIPLDWLVDIVAQARAVGCKIYPKSNSGLRGLTRSGAMQYPGVDPHAIELPKAFEYLRMLPKQDQIG